MLSEQQFYPKSEYIDGFHRVSKDTPLYHGTGGGIKGGIVQPAEREFFGPGAYATESPHSAEFYARESARSEGRLFGTVYEVEPISESAMHAGSEAGKGVITDPEGMRTKRIVGFPLVHDYSDEHAKAKAHKEQSEALTKMIMEL